MQLKDLKKEFIVIKKVQYEKETLQVIVWNGKNKTFRSLEEAKEALKRDMRKEKSNNPIVVNGLGISTENTESKVEYHIEWRWTSKWETVKD